MASREGRVAPPLRLLPTLIGVVALRAADPAADGAMTALPFAVEEHRLELVRLDLFEGSPHLLVLGDAECGKTSLLRLVARQLAARYPPEEVALLVVDLRRGLLDLTALPNLAGYACAPATVAQAVGQLHRELTERTPEAAAADPAAPRYVVLVDDYDLLPASTGSPLLPLLDLLGLGRELGLHLVLARRVAGTARAAFEPVFQRLRELAGTGLVLSGDPGEGPLLGGQKAAHLPPGRGFLVRSPRPPTLVQVLYSPPGRSAEGDSGAGAGRREGRVGER
jgi:S-DNA-T family DNA segregation ATPase FtsK/SpoIIIE